MAALAGRIQTNQSQPRNYTLDREDRNRRAAVPHDLEPREQGKVASELLSIRKLLLLIVVIAQTAGQVERNQCEAGLSVLIVFKADDMLVTLGSGL
jgi:hypothetical protein